MQGFEKDLSGARQDLSTVDCRLSNSWPES